MKVDIDKCIACWNCIPICPVGAIKKSDESTNIDRDQCVECGVCYRSQTCPVDAFVKEELDWPREIRRVFSNPLASHEETKIPGRGTAEIKTNDVTGRFSYGEVGFGIEVGRPGVSARLSEVEKLTSALSNIEGVNIEYMEENPVTVLINEETGKFKDDEILDEKVLSAIIEFIVKEEDMAKVLDVISEEFQKLETVCSLEVITRKTQKDGMGKEIVRTIRDKGFTERPAGKTNIGLGRRLNK